MAYNALVKIQMKRASTSDWNRSTDTGSAWSGYLLREAEIGVEVFQDNSVKLKVGNGINLWRDLPYIDANSAKFVTTLPPISKAEAGTFYVYKGTIYYTTDNVNWNKIGGVTKFDELEDRPKYDNKQMTSKTNIPKIPTTASELKYTNTGSGLSATNVQQAIDEINSNISDSLNKSNDPNTVYGVNNIGEQEQIPYSTSKVIDTIAKRTSTGTIKASDPVDIDDVVTKSYFDTEANNMKTNINNNASNINSLKKIVDENTTNITNMSTDITNMKNDITTNTSNINTNKINITNLTNTVNNLSTGQTDVKNDISSLKQKVDSNTTNITNLQNDLTTEQTTRYNNDLKSITMTGSSKNIITLTKNDNSTMSTIIQMASNTTPGLMTKESYNQIQTNTKDIEDLKNQGGRYIGRSFATKAELDAFTITNSINVGDFTFVVDDETHKGATTKYFCVEKNNVKSFEFAYVIEYDPIGIATNTELGLVLSDNTNGKILVESDGTMSLVGYDSILSKFNDKVDKETSKALSTNDYTNDDKNKVDKIITVGAGTTFLSDDGTYKTIIFPDYDGVKDVQCDGTSVVDVLGIANLHKIATTGNYEDLINIPSNLVKDSDYVHTDNNFTNNYKSLVNNLIATGDGTKFLSDDGTYIELSTVAKTGSYNDLTDIPNNLIEDSNYVHTDNNYTTTEKNKLANIEDNAQVNIIESISVNNNSLSVDSNKNVNIDLTEYAKIVDVPTKLSDLINDNDTVTDADYVHTDNNYTTDEKNKLSDIESNAQVNKIEIIKIDNSPLQINTSDKSVNIALAGFADKVTVEELQDKVNDQGVLIKSLQLGGVWRGIFDTKAALPTNTSQSSKFVGSSIDVNDYIIIKEDETVVDTHGKACKTRYYATAIDESTGEITWTYFDKEEGSIATATNTSLGLVQGTKYVASDETTYGKISVESDGTMSINGLDKLLADYIPLAGNTKTTPINGNLYFNNVGGSSATNDASSKPSLIWSEGSINQKISIFDKNDENVADTFRFLYSTNSGTDWIQLASIMNDGSVKAKYHRGTLIGGDVILPDTKSSSHDSPYKILFTDDENSTNIYQVMRANAKGDLVFSRELQSNESSWMSHLSTEDYETDPSCVAPAAWGSSVAKIDLGSSDWRWSKVFSKVNNISSKAIFSNKVNQQYNETEKCIEFIFE